MFQNSLIPELTVSDFERSLYFYVNILGFHIEYQRETEGFAFLSLEGSQLMIDQVDKTRTWKTAELLPPFGRGINFQIEVSDIQPILDSLLKNNIQLFMDTEEKTYLTDGEKVTVKQFLVQDFDGYLLRFAQKVI